MNIKARPGEEAGARFTARMNTIPKVSYCIASYKRFIWDRILKLAIKPARKYR